MRRISPVSISARALPHIAITRTLCKAKAQSLPTEALRANQAGDGSDGWHWLQNGVRVRQQDVGALTDTYTVCLSVKAVRQARKATRKGLLGMFDARQAGAAARDREGFRGAKTGNVF